MATRAPRPRREFTGCWSCRKRKVKCDEGSPCSACRRLGLQCDGSSTRLIWLNGRQSYRSTGRRYMPCEMTWGSRSPLDSDVVDRLIAQCDDTETEPNDTRWSTTVEYNPFLAFHSHPQTPLQSRANLALANGVTSATHASSDDKFLFQHYVSYVASVMMPVDHPWNPWKRFYPSVSLNYSAPGERALYHSILAHAAFNLAHLGVQSTKMMLLAARHYNKSIQHVNTSIQKLEDQGSTGTLAAIMTLMMAEVYSGQSRKWKHHLQGAWALLNSSSNELWKESQFACFSTQSLLIVKIIGNTTLTDSSYFPLTGTPNLVPTPDSITSKDAISYPSASVNTEITHASSIASTPQFGFTIGAQKSLIECISAITTVSQQIRATPPTKSAFDADHTVSHVLACLEDLQTQTNKVPHLQHNAHSITDLDQPTHQSEDLARYQLNAFIYATYIYLYRALMEVPPKRVAPYVSLTFQNISAFYAQSTGNFSLWPAFIAAVEAYTEEDMRLAREWLERSIHFGLGNRLPIKRIVEEVWKRREDAHFGKAMDQGNITVDWRAVVKDLGIDILLV